MPWIAAVRVGGAARWNTTGTTGPTTQGAAASLSATSSLSLAATSTQQVAAALASSSTLSASATALHPVTAGANLSSTSSLSASGTRTPVATATLSASSDLAVALATFATADLAATSSLVAVPTVAGAASLSASAVLAVDPAGLWRAVQAAANLSATSTLGAAGALDRAAVAALVSVTDLSVDGAVAVNFVNLAARSTLRADGLTPATAAAAVLSAYSTLLATNTGVGTTSAAIVVLVGRRPGVAQFHALPGSFWLPTPVDEAGGSQSVTLGTALSDPLSDPVGSWLVFDATGSQTLTVSASAAFPVTVETWTGDGHDIAELAQLGSGAGTITAPLSAGQRTLVRAYPTTATSVGAASVSWSVAARPDSGVLAFMAADEILETPGWLSVGVACATPGAELEFTLDGAATVVFTTLVDDLGLAAADSVLLPQLAAGGHTITVTDPSTGQSATSSFTVDLEPAIPTPLSADVPPVIDQSTIRWAFMDPAPGGETFAFPINPREMSSPHYVRNVTPDHTLAASGQPIIWEGLPDPTSWTVSGSVETQAHYEALERFYLLRRRFYVIDHLRRAWVVSFESLEFAKKRSANDWANDYTLKFLILAVAS